jgi:hypothetical protein
LKSITNYELQNKQNQEKILNYEAIIRKRQEAGLAKEVEKKKEVVGTVVNKF